MVSLLVLLYRVAREDMHATFLESGGFKFVVKGGTLEKILDDVKGFYIDTETLELKPEAPRVSDEEKIPRRKRGLLERSMGILWVSWLWPIKRIHKFRVVADRAKTGENDLILRRQISFEVREETYLRARFVHPVLITDVELAKDKWKVDMVLKLDLSIFKPATVVFGYKGTVAVMEQIDAAVRAATIDFCNEEDMDYAKFLSEDKGANSKLARMILDLNKPKADTSPENNIAFKGVKDHFGVEIRAAWFEAADLSPEQHELDEAAKAVDKETLLANAKEQIARGEKAMAQALLEGRAEGLSAIVKKLKESGVNISDEQLVRIIFEEVRTGNLAGINSKLTTYVESGGYGVVPTIDINQKEENR